MTHVSTEPMLALAAYFGGEEGTDLVESFAEDHPSDRIRWRAVQARAAAADGIEGRIAVYEKASRSGNLLVGAMAKREIERVEAGRAWIEGGTSTRPLRPA